MATTPAQYAAELDTAFDKWVTDSGAGPMANPNADEQAALLQYVNDVVAARTRHGHPPNVRPRIRKF